MLTRSPAPSHLHLLACSFVLTALLSLSFSLPTQAQSWQVSVTGSPSATSGAGSAWTTPAPSIGSLSLPAFTASKTISTNPGQTLSDSAAYTAAFHFTLTWQPGAGNVPAPAVVRVSESPSAGWSFNTFYQNNGTFDLPAAWPMTASATRPSTRHRLRHTRPKFRSQPALPASTAPCQRP